MTPLLTPRHMRPLTPSNVKRDKARHIMRETLRNPARGISRVSLNYVRRNAELLHGDDFALLFELNRALDNGKVRVIG